MKIEFSNREYVNGHGKQPKGFGVWWFEFCDGYTFHATGTLAEAKKACRQYVKQYLKGYDYYDFVMVNVLP